MRIVVLPSSTAAAGAAASEIARTLRANPRLVMALPTGRTAVPFYAALVRLHRRRRADFSRATTFNLDEFCGLSPDHPGSYHAYMERHVFAHVNLSPRRRHFPDDHASTWRDAIADFESRLAAAGGLDIAVVGIGSNGHLAFNEPAPRLVAGTHRVRLTRGTRRANAYLFGGDVARVPTHALSMGIGTILQGRRVCLLASGRSKAAVVRRALAGPITTSVPASLLQAHPDVVVFLDRAAARELPRDLSSQPS